MLSVEVRAAIALARLENFQEDCKLREALEKEIQAVRDESEKKVTSLRLLYMSQMVIRENLLKNELESLAREEKLRKKLEALSVEELISKAQRAGLSRQALSLSPPEIIDSILQELTKRQFLKSKRTSKHKNKFAQILPTLEEECIEEDEGKKAPVVSDDDDDDAFSNSIQKNIKWKGSYKKGEEGIILKNQLPPPLSQCIPYSSSPASLFFLTTLLFFYTALTLLVQDIK